MNPDLAGADAQPAKVIPTTSIIASIPTKKLLFFIKNSFGGTHRKNIKNRYASIRRHPAFLQKNEDRYLTKVLSHP
jgi:hypothetical protein